MKVPRTFQPFEGIHRRHPETHATGFEQALPERSWYRLPSGWRCSGKDRWFGSIQADDEEGSLGRRQRRNGQEEEGLLPEAPQVHGDPRDDRSGGDLLEAEAGQRSRRRRVARASPSGRRVAGTEAQPSPEDPRHGRGSSALL